jgi:hypothetical protein
MKKTLWWGSSAWLLVGGGVAMFAMSPQDRTLTPGQPTQARVWIQNQGEREAVPVSIQNMASAQPLRVEMTGVPTVTLGLGSVVQARATRQLWEYQAVRIAPGQNPSVILNSAGADGWETSGVALTDQGATVVIMKRPR